MKSTRLIGLAGLFIGGAIVLAACGSDDEDVVPTPIFEPTAAPAGQSPAATASVPTAAAAPTAAPTVAPPPAAPAGEAANGESLFAAQGCSACHSTGDNRIVGPGLSGVGTTAESRVAGQTATAYLTTSIVEPNEFLVPDFPGIMPATFGQTLSEQEISDLVAYLISLP